MVTAVADEEHASLGTAGGGGASARHGATSRMGPSSPSRPTCNCAWRTKALPGRPSPRRAGGPRQPPRRRHRRHRPHGPRAGRAGSGWTAPCRSARAHPLLGHASLHASLIAGGTELSTYPAHCKLQIERRTLPGETRRHGQPPNSRPSLSALHAADPRFQATAELTLVRPPLETPPDPPIAAGAGRRAAAQVLGAAPPVWSAPHSGPTPRCWAMPGIPTVLFGPQRGGAARRCRVGRSGQRRSLRRRAGRHRAHLLRLTEGPVTRRGPRRGCRGPRPGGSTPAAGGNSTPPRRPGKSARPRQTRGASHAQDSSTSSREPSSRGFVTVRGRALAGRTMVYSEPVACWSRPIIVWYNQRRASSIGLACKQAYIEAIIRQAGRTAAQA